jgi:hypothetical protein
LGEGFREETCPPSFNFLSLCLTSLVLLHDFLVQALLTLQNIKVKRGQLLLFQNWQYLGKETNVVQAEVEVDELLKGVLKIFEKFVRFGAIVLEVVHIFVKDLHLLAECLLKFCEC